MAYRGIFTESKSGRRAIRTRVVVDYTADADVAFRAECNYDNETHDVSLGLTLDGISHDEVRAFQEGDPEHYRQIVEEAGSLNGRVMLGNQRYLKGVDIANAEAISRAESYTFVSSARQTQLTVFPISLGTRSAGSTSPLIHSCHGPKWRGSSG